MNIVCSVLFYVMWSPQLKIRFLWSSIWVDEWNGHVDVFFFHYPFSHKHCSLQWTISLNEGTNHGRKGSLEPPGFARRNMVGHLSSCNALTGGPFFGSAKWRWKDPVTWLFATLQTANKKTQLWCLKMKSPTLRGLSDLSSTCVVCFWMAPFRHPGMPLIWIYRVCREPLGGLCFDGEFRLINIFLAKSSGSVYPKRCCFLDDIFFTGSRRFEKGDAIGWLDHSDEDVLAFSRAVSEVDTSMLYCFFFHIYNYVVKNC